MEPVERSLGSIDVRALSLSLLNNATKLICNNVRHQAFFSISEEKEPITKFKKDIKNGFQPQ